MPVTLGSF